jgi:methylenetetrahydrofolate reductase (NADPH)
VPRAPRTPADPAVPAPAPADAHVPTRIPSGGTLREKLEGGVFAVVVELVPWRGTLGDEGGRKALDLAAALAADPRIDAVSVTDNAGGHAMASPEIVGRELRANGQEVIIHAACRDRNRNELLSLGWRLASAGFENVLCLSGDYPVEGYGGLARPVFDIDSVALLRLYTSLNSGAAVGDANGGHGAGAAAAPTTFFLGAVVNPFKRLERELMPQYLKLAMKVREGARFVIPQVGYDARKQAELLRWMALHDLRVPVLLNAFVLTRTTARLFNAGKIPGCTVTDELLAVAEREGASPDKGKAFFRELAAKQLAIARGLGYAGIYLGGLAAYEGYAAILDLAATYGPDDWRGFARELRHGQPDEFYYFEEDPGTGLASERVNQEYARSVGPAGRRAGRRRVPLSYKFDRLVHEVAFKPGTPGFRLGTRVYAKAEEAHLIRPLHVLEEVAKLPLFDCRDCGDCSLPDIAYLCPESQCVKNQRNGPCGGTHDGACEVPGRECIWARAYERLKPYGEADRMLDRPAVITDHALRRTSAWANSFLGRDQIARRSREG